MSIKGLKPKLFNSFDSGFSAAPANLRQQQTALLKGPTTPKPATPPKMGTSAQAATATTNSDVFTDPNVTAALNKDLQRLNGGSTTASRDPNVIVANAELAALTDPTKAAALLKNGVKDPVTGRPLAAPVDPNSALGKVLTKVANKQPVTAAELESVGASTASKPAATKAFMAGMMNSMSSITQQYQQLQSQADQGAGDDDDG